MPEVVTVTLKQDRDFRFAIHFSESMPVVVEVYDNAGVRLK